jgi:hypothetical protein
MRALGFIIIIGGIFMLLLSKISFAKADDAADTTLAGVMQPQNENTALTFYTSGIAILSGVVVLFAAKKKL